jgi:hypothetical protein
MGVACDGQRPIFVQIREVKKPLGRTRLRWEENIKAGSNE